MSNQKLYIPILKAKDGEFGALKEVYPLQKRQMLPLLEIPKIQYDFETGADAKTIEKHLEKIGKNIQAAWGADLAILLDSNLLEGDAKMGDGSHHLTYLFNDFRDRSLKVVPVTGIARHAGYKEAVRKIVLQDGHGICLRLHLDDLTNNDLHLNLDNNLRFYDLYAKDTDLVLDLGSLLNQPISELAEKVAGLIDSKLPYLFEWRSFTVCSAGFPKDLSEVTANTIDTIERLDWKFYNKLNDHLMMVTPSYGDYGIAHPDLVELNPRLVTMSASIRYTHNNYWLIARGVSIKKGGSEQYYALCRNLIARPEYPGHTYSWGDNYIYDCANKAVGPGNGTTWRKVPNNHHFHKVLAQLSSLP